MDERKILLLLLSLVVYSLYSVSVWFTKGIPKEEKLEETLEIKPEPEILVQPDIEIKNKIEQVASKIKTKIIPLHIKNGCSILQIFTEKSPVKCKDNKQEEAESNNNAITVIGITVFLVILVLNAVLDVLKVKEEERARLKLNPDGERRQSLAEFANKKPLRRESSKFGLQLFQIAESVTNGGEKVEKEKPRRQTRQYTRGDSTNSYLSDRKSNSENSAPASVGDGASTEPKLVKRQSIAKLFGLSDD